MSDTLAAGAVGEAETGVSPEARAVGVDSEDGSAAVVGVGAPSRVPSLPPQTAETRVRRTTACASKAGIQSLAILFKERPFHVHLIVSCGTDNRKGEYFQQQVPNALDGAGHLP